MGGAAPKDLAVVTHELRWERNKELREELERLRLLLLLQYARILALVCDAPALIDATDEILAQNSES